MCSLSFNSIFMFLQSVASETLANDHVASEMAASDHVASETSVSDHLASETQAAVVSDTLVDDCDSSVDEQIILRLPVHQQIILSLPVHQQVTVCL